MHTNGIKLWMFKGTSYELVGYGETSETRLGMRSLTLDES